MMRSSFSITSTLRSTRTDAAKTASKRIRSNQCRSKSSALPFRSLSPPTETKRVVGVAGSTTSLASMVAPEKISVIDANNNRRRQQHQLVVSNNASSSSMFQNYPYHDFNSGSTSDDEEQRRLAAMRIFLDSLQLATANTTLSTTKTPTSGSNSLDKSSLAPEISSLELDKDKKQSDSSESIMINGEKNVERTEEEFKLTTKEAQSQSTSESKTFSPPDSTPGSKDFEVLKSTLRHSIYKKDIKKSLFLFRESQRKRQILPRVMVTDLFFMVSEFDPPSGYTIMNYYNAHYLHQDAVQNDGGRALDGNTSKRLSLYKRICNSISLLDPNKHNPRQMHIMMEDLLQEIEEMDMDSKKALYPKLILSLVSQRIATMGQYASDLYYFMVENDFDMRAGWLNRLLSTSRYNRKHDLPYHDVIARLIQTPGGQLNPDAILPAIQNMFPYTETEPICVTLEAWLEDFRNKTGIGDDDNETVFEVKPEILIDLSMLESISTGAAQTGCSRLILLVWEVLDVCGYSPTEMIYENTVMAFANERGGLEQAFAALASMKEDGFEPSRPLIRSFSSAIRLYRNLIGKARRMLTEDRQNEIVSIENNHLLSLESLNVILSSYAERADPKDAVGILDVMSDNGIEPNADSYSFVIEALGRDIKKRLKIDDQSYKQRNIEVADTILSMMEGKGIPPTTHVIRNYVELLCLAGEIETATSIVEEYLKSEDPETRLVVNNITTYRVATENAALGNFDIARNLASMMTEYVPALHRGIRSREQRSSYVNEFVEPAKNPSATDSHDRSSRR